MHKSSEFLLNEFQRQKTLSPALTNSQFAKNLGIPASRLSDYLNGRRVMTVAVAKQITKNLSLNPADLEHLKTLIELDKKSKKTLRSETQLREDEFSVICDWYHFAIMALMTLKSFQSDPAWIGERLNIPAEVAQAALDRLLRLGLIELKDKKFVATRRQLETTHNIPSDSLRRSHRQSLQQVVDQLDTVPVHLRDVTSITFAINRKKIAEAKGIIRKFRRKMADLMSQGPKTDVYNLNIQLFPVTKVTK
ncbi:TIGR02147 family protein [Bdellovibrio svalbardensis]|uniref:TIGR02147 family protein n=1 Tax=Bdellovibrio svalbardensis TaxID=2972972 RepID=A0ABT6DGP8_9BACT|nr:TIGR02147 family protein [Bdellovibrio svalbardensis]MDG0815089.1 TIGR02147 family protein [Bdellovibrio svalbardensis]